MENPFIFGEPAKGEKFIDRKRELERLRNYIINARNVIIYSPRRFGKTSLILKVLEELKGDIISIFIDCYSVTSEKDLASRLTKKVLQHYKGKEIWYAVKKLFQNITPKITIETTPSVQIEISYEGVENWEEALDLPQKLALDKGKRVVVVFDEFQELAKFDNLLKLLRSRFQHHDKVSYIFIGSKRHLMEWIFKSKESPFYNFGVHITLKEIPKKEFEIYIRDAFKRGNIEIKEHVVDLILSLTRCHPYYTQRLCFELWYVGTLKKVVDEKDVEKTLSELISDLEDSYLLIWESLTPNQRKALLAVAKGEEDLFSGEFLRKYDFKSPASVQSALRKLVEKELVTKIGEAYKVSDVFMEYWLKKRFLEE
ncbi:AAA family ATPase [Thermococcus barophilus]|uniref:ATPase n=1 Tax=Thermococcus barophilus TaxID=55802 RepID=A0A0S1XF69_THEBA|nr:ATP-binding protein [Thermococcus barophilus]ALM76344.1 Putative ATPase [Thermococcus barophilus]